MFVSLVSFPTFSQRNDDSLVTLLPARRNKSLARDDRSGEADLDILEGTKVLEHVFAGNTERAEPVKDRLVETAHLGKAWVDVQRVVVARQTVCARKRLCARVSRKKAGRKNASETYKGQPASRRSSPR